MSTNSGLRNIRTSTTLAISGIITLLAVVFMTLTYSTYIEIGAKFQQRNADLNDLTTNINTIRSSVQWVYSYENDIQLERQTKDIRSGVYLYWEKINLFHRRTHLTNATNALERIDTYLRDEEHQEITAVLNKAFKERFVILADQEQRNESNNQIAEKAQDGLADTGSIDTSIHASMTNAISTLYAVDAKLRKLEDLGIQYKEADRQESLLATQENTQQFYISLGLVFLALLLNAILFKFGILRPITQLMNTIRQVREGDDSARSGLNSKNELGQLGGVLDQLLDEKNQLLETKEAESDALNQSVISLIQNVFQLSQRDLTVRVPVAEDITGAVADSINQLAQSIDTTLKDVIQVSQRVDDASQEIHSQSEKVLVHSSNEQEEITQTLHELDSVINAMQLISQLATVSHDTSKQAINTSENAMSSVSETINSINMIRDTIHEAEKRIKRLGERSQEIGGIVSLIKNISERTHILSLNASMHAASAGEAGRGLTVVVDEVQRLAENSREATAEIETLVNNIQLETSDTIQVMNTVITEVVTGTRLAEEAGKRMDDTRTATHSMVESVVRIAKSATSQTEVAKQLQSRAINISESADVTNDEMQRQSLLSEQLVNAAETLQQSVGVFQLTEDTATAQAS